MEDQVQKLLIPENTSHQLGIPLVPTVVSYTYDEVIAQNKSLSDELSQCKADKDFVWGLWKQLQSNKPDVSDAIQTVLAREKEKAEQKDIKILAILKQKDDEIKSLQSMSNDLENELKTSSERLTKLIYDQTHWGSTVLELESRIKKQNEILSAQQQESHDKLITKDKELSSCNQENKSMKTEIEDLKNLVNDLRSNLKTSEESAESMKVAKDQIEKQENNAMDLEKELDVLKHKMLVQERHSDELTKEIAKEKKRSDKYKTLAEGLRNECRKKSEDLRNAEEALTKQMNQIEKQNNVLKNMDKLQNESQQAISEMQSSHQLEICSLKESIESLVRSLKTAREENVNLNSKINKVVNDHESTLKQKDAEIERLKYVSNANSILNESLRQRHQNELEQINGHILSEKEATQIEENLKVMSAALKEKSREISFLESELIKKRNEENSMKANNFEVEHYKKTNENLQRIVQSQSDELEETRQAHLGRLERYKTLKADYKLVVELLKTYDDKAFLNGLEARRSSTPKRHHRSAVNERQSLSMESQLTNYREECQLLIEKQKDLEEERSELKVECARFQSTVNELKSKLDEKCKEIENHRQETHHKQHYVSPTKVNVLDEKLQAWMDKAKFSEDRLANVEMINEKLSKQKSILEQEIRDMMAELSKKETLDAHLQTDLDSFGISKASKTYKAAQTSPIKEHFSRRLFDQCTQTTGDSSSEESTVDDSLREQPISFQHFTQRDDREEDTDTSYWNSTTKDALVKPIASATPISVKNGKTKQLRNQSYKQNKVLLKRIAAMEKQITALRESKQTVAKELLDTKAINERQQGELVAIQQKLFVSKQTIQRQNVDINKLTSEKDHVNKEHKKEEGKLRQKDIAIVRDLEERLRNSAENHSRVSLEAKTLKRENEELSSKLKDYNERLLKMDRMLHQKRVLVDELKEKAKTCQNELSSEKESNELIKKKVKTLTDREGQRQTYIDNLKTKLTDIGTEKSDLQQTILHLRDELSKKVSLLKESQALCLKAEHAIVEIETAYKQRLASTKDGSTLELNKSNAEIKTLKGNVTYYQTFIKSLYDELMRQIHDCRLVLKERQRKIIEREKQKAKDENQSMKDAKTKACSILNISNNDLATFMVANETEEDDNEFSEAIEMDIRERLDAILADTEQDVSTLLFEDVMQLISLAFRFTYLEKSGTEERN